MKSKFSIYLLLALFSLTSCGKPPTSPTKTAENTPVKTASPDSPSVLLITLDTTRADRLGCYGHAQARTPALDGLAAGGARFERAYCQAPLTLPSHTSLMTSTYPPTNGLRVNGSAVLGTNLATLAEMFQQRGYRTGAFVSAWVLNSAFGLARGFDHYDDKIGDDAGDSLYQERIGDKTCDAALAWLSEKPDVPFFAWVHFFDPHYPYAPPPPPPGEQFEDPYDGEIAFMDSQIARLLEWLDKSGRRERTLIVAVGDHGEAFGENGETEHGLFIYGVTLHVPLIVCPPRDASRLKDFSLTSPRVVAAPVGIIDVAPTVLDLLGQTAPASMQGRSLRVLMTSDTAPARPVYSESRYGLTGFGWAELRGLLAPPWKYIDAPRAELYNLDADPGETKNLATEQGDVAADLRRQLTDLVTSMPKFAAAKIQLSDEALRTLEGLGYVGATTEEDEADDDDAEAEKRRDPKDMVGVFNDFQRAREINKQGRPAEAAALLSAIVEQSPESDEIFAELGDAYLKLGKNAEAEAAYLKSLRVDPASARKLCLLGDAIYRQGRVDDAVACYQKALQISPNYGQAYNRMGNVFADKKQWQEAARYLGKHVELAPDSPDALTNLANVLTQIGKHDEALQRLTQALALNPRFVPAHQYLWQVLKAMNRIPEMLNALRSACRALPADAGFKRTLAGMIVRYSKAASTVDLNEAVTLGQECCRLEPENPQNFDLLGIAQAATGDFAGAVESARQAIELAQKQGRNDLAARIAERLRRYQGGEQP